MQPRLLVIVIVVGLITAFTPMAQRASQHALEAITAVTTQGQLQYLFYASEECGLDEIDVRAETDQLFLEANIDQEQRKGDWHLGISIMCSEWDGVLAFRIDLVFTRIASKPEVRLNWNHGIYGAGDSDLVLGAYVHSLRTTLADYNLAHRLY